MRAFLAVHPRARGEHVRCRPTTRSDSRFIPALAGNIRIGNDENEKWPVHPRARGEHFQLLIPTLPHVGSSPRSRGTLDGDL